MGLVSIYHHNRERNEKSAYNMLTASKEKSPFLVAAKMGVIEMVKEILDEFPVALDDMNQEKKNAVLLAVENRQPSVYLYLQKTYRENESVFQKVDCRGNGALHLAATFGPSRPWRIPGAVLQMQWEVKWYQVHLSPPLYLYRFSRLIYHHCYQSLVP